jgi:hypothetical protein
VRDDRPPGSEAASAVWFAYSPDRKGEHQGLIITESCSTIIDDMPSETPDIGPPGSGRLVRARRMTGAA